MLLSTVSSISPRSNTPPCPWTTFSRLKVLIRLSDFISSSLFPRARRGTGVRTSLATRTLSSRIWATIPSVVWPGECIRWIVFSPRRRSRLGFKGLIYSKLRGRGDAEAFWALRRLSLQVEEGELLGIIGRNGAGKTTLARVISGIYPVDEGSLTVRGRVTSLAPGVGFVPDMPGRQNIYLHCALVGLPPENAERIAPQIIEFSELGEFIDKPIRSYSNGMQARLAFSIAVHFEPDILVIDETLGVGDEAFRAKATEKIHEMLGKARAAVVITHSLFFVRNHCTRAVWLHDGAVEAAGDPTAVTDQYSAFVKEHLKQPSGQLVQRR